MDIAEWALGKRPCKRLTRFQSTHLRSFYDDLPAPKLVWDSYRALLLAGIDLQTHVRDKHLTAEEAGTITPHEFKQHKRRMRDRQKRDREAQEERIGAPQGDDVTPTERPKKKARMRPKRVSELEAVWNENAAQLDRSCARAKLTLDDRESRRGVCQRGPAQRPQSDDSSSTLVIPSMPRPYALSRNHLLHSRCRWSSRLG